MQRSFDHNLIEIRKNPFSSTRSVSIRSGFFMKDLRGENTFAPSTDSLVNIGFLPKLVNKISSIEDSSKPQHIMIFGEYGQGKSYALNKIEEEIYVKYGGAIISYPIGGNAEMFKNNKKFFKDRLLEDIEELFKGLNPALYTDKEEIKEKYHLESEKDFHQSLEAYDKVFKELNILLYIFIDELDKIVISELPKDVIRQFLEDIKLVGDTCNDSVSLLVAGTNNCNYAIDEKFSIDYGERFDKIEINYLTAEQTIDYISAKCNTILDYVGHHPFDRAVKRMIFHLTDGNIRKIETLCRELWIYSARNDKKINSNILNLYLRNNLFEPVKNIMNKRELDDSVIEFIIEIFINGGRLGSSKVNSFWSQRKLNKIFGFIKDYNYVKKIKRSYTLNSDIKIKISEILQK